jgi:hypothetical protein
VLHGHAGSEHLDLDARALGLASALDLVASALPAGEAGGG